MPYTVSELKDDSRFKGMPEHALELFAAAYNSANEQYAGEEAKCFATAWAAVKDKYKKDDSGQWVQMSVTDEEAAALDSVEAFMAVQQATPFSNPERAEATFAVEREAKVFEAGSYEDKGVEVTEEDLDNIVANHQPAPLKIEHSDTPFDGAIGTLDKLWRKGKELFGKLAFTDEAWALIEKTGIKSLSVGLKRDKSGIAEVSLVRSPRIADARVFSTDLVGFSVDLNWGSESTATPIHQEVVTLATETIEKMDVNEAIQAIQKLRPDSPEAQAIYDAARQMVDFKKSADEELIKTGQAAAAAVAALQEANTESLILKFRQEGKIVPAVEALARAIISRKPLAGAPVRSEETVKFKIGDEDVVAHFADVFVEYLKLVPPVVSFREFGAMGSNDAPATEIEKQIFSALGVTEEQVKAASIIKTPGRS
jgi:cation transport regulator